MYRFSPLYIHGDSKSFARPALVVLPLLLGCQSVETPVDPGQWEEPTLIEMNVASTGPPDVAVDHEGNAVAVWAQTDEGFQNASDDIRSNRRERGGEWAAEATTIEENELGESFRPRIGIDGDGRVLVVFLQEEEDAERFSVWAARDTPSGEWEVRCIQSTSIDTDCSALNARGDAGRAQLAVDEQGNGVAVWEEATDDGVGIWLNRFTPDTGWGEAKAIETDSNDLLRPQVAIDGNRNATVVWERLDSATDISSIWSKRQASSGDWELLRPVNDKLGNAFDPQVVADAAGNAIAVWQQEDPDGSSSIWSNRYVSATSSWGGPDPIDAPSAANSERPQLAIDAVGNAIAVWSRSGDDRAGIWSNRYVTGVGWGSAEAIGPRGLGSARDPDIAANIEGNAVAVWLQFDGVQDRIWSNRYAAAGGWGTSETIASEDAPMEDAPQVDSPRIALDREGNAVAVWAQNQVQSGVEDIYSSRLDALE